MKKIDFRKIILKIKQKGGLSHFLLYLRKHYNINLILQRIFQIIFVCSLVTTGVVLIEKGRDNSKIQEQQEALLLEKEEKNETSYLLTAGVSTLLDIAKASDIQAQGPQILPEYWSLYQENPDLIGWLKIDNTVIDYPVMQTPEDEGYYLVYDFNKQKNSNGSLILDTDSNAGVGNQPNHYAGGNTPSTNLIIHGHTMESGQMFGDLQLYKEKDYGGAHNIISFDSLYEKREYELIAVFYSQVYYKNQDVFKYYKFFQADTQEEFDNWYDNIKAMSLYDTGVTAEFGDEFITLSCCSYQVEDGRFVVVGKRIQ